MKESEQGLPFLLFWEAFSLIPALITNTLFENRERIVLEKFKKIHRTSEVLLSLNILH